MKGFELIASGNKASTSPGTDSSPGLGGGTYAVGLAVNLACVGASVGILVGNGSLNVGGFVRGALVGRGALVARTGVGLRVLVEASARMDSSSLP